MAFLRVFRECVLSEISNRRKRIAYDSPWSLFSGGIIPELDIYAIPSCEHAPVKEIYFIAIIDVLTHYGVKKQAAKAAKTVKYGSNVDGISTCDPEQYARRFLDFMSKAIE